MIWHGNKRFTAQAQPLFFHCGGNHFVSFTRKQIDELEMQLESMDNSDSRLTVKQLESKKKQLKTKLSNLLDAPKRDDVVTFEELGADSLMVDEAHNLRTS